jgi:hypothetical protein
MYASLKHAPDKSLPDPQVKQWNARKDVASRCGSVARNFVDLLLRETKLRTADIAETTTLARSMRSVELIFLRHSFNQPGSADVRNAVRLHRVMV